MGLFLAPEDACGQKWRLSFDAQVSSIGPDEIVELLQTHAALKQTFGNPRQSRDELARQVEWLRRQIFGANSERRILDEIGHQMILGKVNPAERAAAAEIEIPTRHRRRAEAPNEVEAQPIRLDESVQVVAIELGDREITYPENQTLVGEKVTEGLAQRKGSYVVQRIVRKVYKRKTEAGVGTRRINRLTREFPACRR